MESSDTFLNMNLLPGLPVSPIRAAYLNAPGDEIGSGKFASPESSAALVANTFGLFLDRPRFPPLPNTKDLGSRVLSVQLETIVRFPWAGGRHPCLDALIETETALIGVESKRFEPFRNKVPATFSDAILRPVWGEHMRRFERIRDDLRSGSARFAKLDAVQLVKHAFALRTAVHRDRRWRDKRPVLYYIYAEPECWPQGRTITLNERIRHRDEIVRFASAVQSDEVLFRYCSYKDWLSEWFRSEQELVGAHAVQVNREFKP